MKDFQSSGCRTPRCESSRPTYRLKLNGIISNGRKPVSVVSGAFLAFGFSYWMQYSHETDCSPHFHLGPFMCVFCDVHLRKQYLRCLIKSDKSTLINNFPITPETTTNFVVAISTIKMRACIKIVNETYEISA